MHTQTSNQVLQESDWRNPRRARSVAASDQIVSIILEVLERTKTWDDTAVIVTGDHGNTEVHSQIRPNVWLVEAGLRGRRLEQEDWRETFHALGGSAFLRVRNDAAVVAVRRVLDALPQQCVSCSASWSARSFDTRCGSRGAVCPRRILGFRD